MSRRQAIAKRTTAASGGFIAARFAARIIDLVSITLLARLLTPEDFGLVAIAVVMMQILETVFEVPFYAALLRARPLQRRMIDTAFTLSLGRGLLTAILLAAAAFPAAAIYDDPRLAPLVLVLAIAPLARSVRSPRMVLYSRRLDARPELFIEVSSKLAAFIVSLTLAWSTGSYWAIALGAVVAPIAGGAMSFIWAPYAPRLRMKEWRFFFEFAGWLTVNLVFSALLWQFDKLYLGGRITEAELGAYFIASTLAHLPFTIVAQPVLRPFAAAFTLSDAKQRLSGAYIKAITAITLVTAPIVLSFSILAEPATYLLLGPGWEQAGLWVSLLTLPVLIAVQKHVVMSACVALHRTHYAAAMGAVEFALFIPALVIGFASFGMIGAVAARLVVAVLLWPVTIIVAKRLTGVEYVRQLGALSRPAIGAAAMLTVLMSLGALLSWDGTALGSLVYIGVLGGAALCAYLLAVLAAWRAAGKPDGLEQIAWSMAGTMMRRSGALLRKAD